MYQFLLRSFAVFCAAFILILPSAQAESQRGINQKTVSLQKQINTATTKLERVRDNLENAKSLLIQTKEQQSAANEAMQSDQSELASRRAKLIDIRLDRYISKVNRLQSSENELKTSIAQYQRQLKTLASTKPAPRQVNKESVKRATPQAVQVAAISRSKPLPVKANKARVVKSSKSAQAAVSKQPPTWPSLTAERQQDIVYAKVLLQKLEEAAEKGSKGVEPLDEVKVTNRHSFGKLEMAYLGNNLYSLTKTLKPGGQSFQIFNKTYSHTIPDEGQEEEYRIIYDISSTSKPRFYLFREALVQ